MDEPRVGATFSHEVVAGPGVIDALGHVTNLAYLRWVQDVAVAHSAQLGWDLAAYQAIGAVFVVRRHEIDYLSPALEGHRLAVTTWIEAWRAATCVRRTRFEGPSGVEVARAATTWAFVDAATGRPKRIPAPLRAAFGSPAQRS